MLKKMDESAGNVIGFQIIGVLEKADFATLTEEVQTAIDEAGSAKLSLDFDRMFQIPSSPSARV